MLTQLSTLRENRSRGLVDLLGECHQRIRHFVELARQAASREDASDEQVVQACADVERYFSEALPLHIADEEQSIEPRLRGRLPSVDQALDAMAHEHQQHAASLETFLRTTANVRCKPHDERARAQLATAAIALELEFEAHLALEESVIFPAIQELLQPETQAAIIDELRERRSPLTSVAAKDNDT